jgi:hypothetical protein
MATRRQDVLLKGSSALMGLTFCMDVPVVQNAVYWTSHLEALPSVKPIHRHVASRESGTHRQLSRSLRAIAIL